MNEKNKDIYVTKTFLPPISEYNYYLNNIWKSAKLTNQGPVLKEFESELRHYLNIENIHFVINGTVALQLAIRALDIDGSDIITTPFSYVATTSAILWEKCRPVFVDIDINTLCIDASKIEKSITKNTKAILAVHVFGIPCDIENIELIARKHNLKVIYDGAHAFGVKYKGKSLLDYGDISTCSFHSTKLFHTIEGGCVISRDNAISEKLELMKRFGHHGDDHLFLGINAKASEFQAAMGLCNLKYIDNIIASRKKMSELYDSLIGEKFIRPVKNISLEYNYAYYPLIFSSEKELLKVVNRLNTLNIFPRRYFYPSLNKLPYLDKEQSCPISESISSRILCLPLYYDLENGDIIKICNEIKKVVYNR